MKYYSLESCGIETTKFCEPEVFGEWEDEFLKGNCWKDRTLKLPITMSVVNKYNPGDYPLADSHLVSQKLLIIIKQLNKDLEVLPTQLFYKAKEPIWDTYYTILFPEYDAFNFKKSEYDTGIDGEGVCLIDKLVLSKEKLFLVDKTNNIFVLKETKLDVICTEIAKNMIESAGIKDVRFTELPVE